MKLNDQIIGLDLISMFNQPGHPPGEDGCCRQLATGTSCPGELHATTEEPWILVEPAWSWPSAPPPTVPPSPRRLLVVHLEGAKSVFLPQQRVPNPLVGQKQGYLMC